VPRATEYRQGEDSTSGHALFVGSRNPRRGIGCNCNWSIDNGIGRKERSSARAVVSVMAILRQQPQDKGTMRHDVSRVREHNAFSVRISGSLGMEAEDHPAETGTACRRPSLMPT
jgi:hypothetical protein